MKHGHARTQALVHLVAADDDVAVALKAIPAGAMVSVGGVEMRAAAAIPRGHKMAVGAIAPVLLVTAARERRPRA